jgi:hypothetical protein
VLQQGQRASKLRETRCQTSAGNSAVSPPQVVGAEESWASQRHTARRPQKRDVTEVELVQLDVLGLLLGLDLGDLGLQGSMVRPAGYSTAPAEVGEPNLDVSHRDFL